MPVFSVDRWCRQQRAAAQPWLHRRAGADAAIDVKHDALPSPARPAQLERRNVSIGQTGKPLLFGFLTTTPSVGWNQFLLDGPLEHRAHTVHKLAGSERRCGAPLAPVNDDLLVDRRKRSRSRQDRHSECLRSAQAAPANCFKIAPPVGWQRCWCLHENTGNRNRERARHSRRAPSHGRKCLSNRPYKPSHQRVVCSYKHR